MNTNRQSAANWKDQKTKLNWAEIQWSLTKAFDLYNVLKMDMNLNMNLSSHALSYLKQFAQKLYKTLAE